MERCGNGFQGSRVEAWPGMRRADITVDRRGGIPDSARVVSGNTVQIRHPFGGLVTITGGPGGETNQFRM